MAVSYAVPAEAVFPPELSGNPPSALSSVLTVTEKGPVQSENGHYQTMRGLS